MNNCPGCGVELNYEDKDNIGFAFEKNKDGHCQRCYLMNNFNQVPSAYLSNDDYKKLLKSVVKKDNLIVWVIDIFDFNSGLHEFIESVVKDCKVLIVANKVDILPKSANHDKLTRWIKSIVSQKVNIVDILVTSAEKRLNVDELTIAIEDTGAKVAYFVGTTNVGKSTMINKIIRAIDSKKEEFLTTSYYAGTTLGKVEVKIDSKLTVIDTPGIINEAQVGHYLTKDSLKVIMPTRELRPVTYQLQSNQTLFITGLVQVNFVSGQCKSTTVYCSNKIVIHRTNMDNAETIREKHYGDSLLQVPREADNLECRFKKVKFKVKRNQDIFVSGICFIALKGIKEPLEIEVILPEFAVVVLRENLI